MTDHRVCSFGEQTLLRKLEVSQDAIGGCTRLRAAPENQMESRSSTELQWLRWILINDAERAHVCTRTAADVVSWQMQERLQDAPVSDKREQGNLNIAGQLPFSASDSKTCVYRRISTCIRCRRTAALPCDHCTSITFERRGLFVVR
jgi:hypothetical protein